MISTRGRAGRGLLWGLVLLIPAGRHAQAAALYPTPVAGPEIEIDGAATRRASVGDVQHVDATASGQYTLFGWVERDNHLETSLVRVVRVAPDGTIVDGTPLDVPGS